MVTSKDGKRRILNFLGGQYVERWPESEARAFFFTQELTYDDRIALGTFLYGNLRDVDLVYNALAEQLGSDLRDHDHMRRWLADLASGNYDDRVYYFEVLHAPDFYYLNGTRNVERAPPQPFVRCIGMHGRWSGRACGGRRVAGRRWPSSAQY